MCNSVIHVGSAEWDLTLFSDDIECLISLFPPFFLWVGSNKGKKNPSLSPLCNLWLFSPFATSSKPSFKKERENELAGRKIEGGLLGSGFFPPYSTFDSRSWKKTLFEVIPDQQGYAMGERCTRLEVLSNYIKLDNLFRVLCTSNRVPRKYVLNEFVLNVKAHELHKSSISKYPCLYGLHPCENIPPSVGRIHPDPIICFAPGKRERKVSLLIRLLRGINERV